jgi:hypothetical protein
MEPCGKFKEGAQKGSAIIIDQLDQTGFLNQASQLDQVPGACTPILNPLALIIACAIPVQSITQHGQTV